MDKFPAGGEVLGRMRRSQLQRLSKYYLMSIVSHQNRFVNIEFLVVSLCEKSFYTAVIESLQYMCTKGEKNPLKKAIVFQTRLQRAGKLAASLPDGYFCARRRGRSFRITCTASVLAVWSCGVTNLKYLCVAAIIRIWERKQEHD